MRIALGVEYDGSQFHGWQTQPGLRTAQTELEKAISKVANEPITVNCAGRTDTGVHATGQVVHFDTSVERSQRSWVLGTNSNLDKDICVRWARIVNDDFHARFAALSRSYRYIIYNNSVRNSLFSTYLTWQYRPLDVSKMAEAAKSLVGKHDFTSFRALACQAKSPVRTVENISVVRDGDFIFIDITANAFLHHMVRNIAGVLIAIGSGRHHPEWIKEVLSATDRAAAAETAPPYGLYLVSVKYPAVFDLPQEQVGPLFFGTSNVRFPT